MFFLTMGILLDYKIVDPVMLKAAVIHDLFENALGMPGVTREEARLAFEAAARKADVLVH